MADMDKLKEKIARALCPTDPDDLPRDAEGNVTANIPAWTYYVEEAEAALTAIESAGFVLMPKDQILRKMSKDEFSELMAGIRFKEMSDG